MASKPDPWLARFSLGCFRLFQAAIASLALAGSVRGAERIQTDLCVWGGTSGGVVAAVQAARMGRSVVLVEVGRHLGGMTSGGLGRTDIGQSATIGGLAGEFYTAVGRHYGGPRQFTFEPRVAEAIFRLWIDQHRIPVYFEQRLAAVRTSARRIIEIEMENGNVFEADGFIDASYEGDLMARAGVAYTVGRESNAQYGETLNGIRPSTPSHQFVVPVDPYVIPGHPSSGLLPCIQPGDGGIPGEGDHRVQAYNFRLCLTQIATNQLPIGPPTGYDPARYALLGRYLEARVAAGQNPQLSSLLSIGSMPNGKTDINNNGAFSTDYIGGNYEYPDGDYAARDRIWRDTLDYIQGFLYYLGAEPRVPASIRSEMRSWGLCRDEFVDTGGWPHQMYIREARRMVSGYVMTEHHGRGTRVASNSIGLASYNMDSHNCQRVVQNSVVRNEGDVQVGVAQPFPIAYESIIPATGQCENLWVTFCLSASHIAFSSIRMEPVFMIVSQSAATAAAIALEESAAAQQVNYRRLAIHLLADSQRLQWSGAADIPTGGIVIDSEDTIGVTRTGSWSNSTSVAGYHGLGYLHDMNEAKGLKSVQLAPDLPDPGNYTVYIRWTQHANRATQTPVHVLHQNGASSFTVNQTQNGGTWFRLGTFPFAAGSAGSVRIETAGTTGYVIADAALWQPAGTPASAVEIAASRPIASEAGPGLGAFTLVRTGDASGELTVRYAISGTADPAADYAALPGQAVFSAGQNTASIVVQPLPDAACEGDETVVLSLQTGSDYSLGPLRSAALTIRDSPYDAWRFTAFTPPDRGQPSISGETADPDADRLANLWEMFHGLDPRQQESSVLLRIVRLDNEFALETSRHRQAADLHVVLETSADLREWAPAPAGLQTPRILRQAPFETLRYTLGSVDPPSPPRFWRLRLEAPASP